MNKKKVGMVIIILLAVFFSFLFVSFSVKAASNCWCSVQNKCTLNIPAEECVTFGPDCQSQDTCPGYVACFCAMKNNSCELVKGGGEDCQAAGCNILTECPKPAEKQTDTFSNLQQQAASGLNPAGFGEVPDFIGQVLKFLMGALGSIALALYVWAGFLWMTAAGNAERAGKAKTLLFWTTLGVVGALASYTLVKFIFQALELSV
ncbi:hypothetical protein EPN28_01500 [Patescibacteria group bacterium]|nr:MAG: hypothetical protein EPN28_01500 [Patescibacteria group bacterium]